MGEMSPERKSGCGLLNAVFGRNKFWPRRSASSTSLSTQSTATGFTASKRRRGGSDDIDRAILAPLSPPHPPPHNPKIPPSNNQYHNQRHLHNHQQPLQQQPVQNEIITNKNNNKNMVSPAKNQSGHEQMQQQQQNRKVPKESLGISGELESMIMEQQQRGCAAAGYAGATAGANLVRVSSGNVMVHKSLGNLRPNSGGPLYTYSKPESQSEPDYTKYSNTTMGNIVKQQNRNNNINNNNKLVDSNKDSNGLCRAISCRMDPEELKIMGNEDYKNGRFADALALYERAIDLDPMKASYRSNKSAALTALGRLLEAVFECREAISIEPHYQRAHHRLANLYLRLGEAEKAIYHYRQAGPEADPDAITKANIVLSHLKKCDDAKRLKDWNSVLRESASAISVGADSAPLVYALQAEAYLKLHRHQDADATMSQAPSFDIKQCTKFFGPIGNAALLVIQAQVHLVAGRFDDAIAAAQQASRLDPSNREVGVVMRRARAVVAARSKGNELFKKGRFAEACAAYEQGLEHEPYNSVLLCNRAACRSKLSQHEKAVEDCTSALNLRPSYTKARFRRANCNSKLGRWEASVQDYEILLRETPLDEDIGRALFEAQVQLKKRRGEDVSGLKFGDIQLVVIQSNERFRPLTTWPGISAVWFCNKPGDKRTFHFLEQLSKKYPTVNFLKVEIEGNKYLSKSEGVSSLPAFVIYKGGLRVKEIPGDKHESLESSIKSYGEI